MCIVHVHFKHSNGTTENNQGFKCRTCGSNFPIWAELMDHRKTKHLSSVAYCGKNANGICNYTSELCWWKHIENSDQSIECYVCGKMFDCKSNMMTHRKKVHAETIKPCYQYFEKKCRFDGESCWFIHVNVQKSNDGPSVFRNAPQKKEPPLKRC